MLYVGSATTGTFQLTTGMWRFDSVHQHSKQSDQ
nr:MAG TPA: hypothetical protein [Caudoviricetes sp.]